MLAALVQSCMINNFGILSYPSRMYLISQSLYYTYIISVVSSESLQIWLAGQCRFATWASLCALSEKITVLHFVYTDTVARQP